MQLVAGWGTVSLLKLSSVAFHSLVKRPINVPQLHIKNGYPNDFLQNNLKTKKKKNKKKKEKHINIFAFIWPPTSQAGYDTRSAFKQSTDDLNLEFFFS